MNRQAKATENDFFRELCFTPALLHRVHDGSVAGSGRQARTRGRSTASCATSLISMSSRSTISTRAPIEVAHGMLASADGATQAPPASAASLASLIATMKLRMTDAIDVNCVGVISCLVPALSRTDPGNWLAAIDTCRPVMFTWSCGLQP